MIVPNAPNATSPPGIMMCSGLPGFESSWSYSTTSCVFAATCRARYWDCVILFIFLVEQDGILLYKLLRQLIRRCIHLSQNHGDLSFGQIGMSNRIKHITESIFQHDSYETP